MDQETLDRRTNRDGEARNRDIRRTVDLEIQTAIRMREILIQASRDIQALDFIVSPVEGYDVPDVIDLLHDMTPRNDDAMRAKIRRAAADRVDGLSIDYAE